MGEDALDHHTNIYKEFLGRIGATLACSTAVTHRCAAEAQPEQRPLPDLLAPVPVVGFPRQHPSSPYIGKPHAVDVQ